MNVIWEHRTLGDLYDVRDGTHDSPEYHSDGFPLITSKNLKSDGLSFDKVRLISEKDYISINKRSAVDKGDILFAMIGTIGNPTLVTINPNFAIKNVALFKIPQNQSNKFLKYYLESNFVISKMMAEAKGTTQKFVGLGYLRNFPINIPQLTEQQRIVAILDEAFEAISAARANAEQNLQNARALFESYLQSVFSERGEGSKEMRLADISKDFGRGKSKHRPRNDPKLYGGSYPFIQTGDVRNSGHLITTYTQTYNDVGLAQSKLWPKGTLCITIAANIAETGILDFDACFPDSVIGVVANDEITSTKYLEYLLQSFKTHLQAKGKGSAQDNINLGTFENQYFPFADLKKQEEIVATLDILSQEIQRLDILYQRKIAALDELKQSLLHQAFSGQL
ncbi:restriction endonuclease subunit S [Aeromonas piscicola]|uniref:restriction endonuclease subunit S n=1 Tax=Aeromonas piscicola TaxID=600645 RepID=UPI0021F85CA7|nr:restriction endonuclease subunit S [Aeromonas piscicola]MCW0507203.1 restriction endonuclease subunit S [Aeromonas piscicola]